MLDPERFRRQVLTLERRGYRFVTLSEFTEHLDVDAPPDGLCALTFDDGTVDNLELLAPILSALRMPATVFVCPGLLGQPHFAMPAAAGVRLMDADQLRALASSPLIEIGSHTNTHVELSSATAQEAYEEMSSSKAALEQLLDSSIDYFAYPKCGYSPHCPGAARRAGYAVAVTCAGLGGWRRFELGRESIDSLDRRVSFALKSRGLFIPLRNSLPGRLARAAARPLRHRGLE
ncbi:MAG TPA: polysaccharide deacetylase family protein [Solirubrobacteraceae bacterium]|jgi:peptidoglycan/xylan/chitin deacetylase (PgdA/CDA1 family)|nr:polysaccharide deacetylase family protein [Solirubrobacteraceae bacterium]